MMTTNQPCTARASSLADLPSGLPNQFRAKLPGDLPSGIASEQIPKAVGHLDETLDRPDATTARGLSPSRLSAHVRPMTKRSTNRCLRCFSGFATGGFCYCGLGPVPKDNR